MSESPKIELWEYEGDRELLRPFESPQEAIADWFHTFWIPGSGNSALDRYHTQQDWPIPPHQKGLRIRPDAGGHG